MSILYALKAIKQEGPRAKSLGICWNLREELGARIYNTYPRCFVEDCIRSWPHFSGELAYPVPSPLPLVDAKTYYKSSYPKWDINTPYGKMRYDLLDHMIKCAEAQGL